MCPARHAASFARDRPLSSVPATRKLPEVGESMPAMRFKSVVFPLPDGPIKARNEPCSICRSRSLSGVISVSPFLNERVSLWHSM